MLRLEASVRVQKHREQKPWKLERRNNLPTRPRASLALTKACNHSIEKVALRIS